MLPEIVVLTGLDPVVVGRMSRVMCRFDDTVAVTYDLRAVRVEALLVPPAEVTRGV